MDKDWPSTWTTSYVSSNQTKCLERLKEMLSMLIEDIGHESYFFAIQALKSSKLSKTFLSISKKHLTFS